MLAAHEELTDTPWGVAVTLALIAMLVAPTWLAWWNSRLAKKEFQPNGGDSLKDKVNLTYDMVLIAKERATMNHIRLNEVAADVTTAQENIHGIVEELGHVSGKLDGHIQFMNKAHSGTRKEDPPDFKPRRL